jgi:hypothetical protein
MYGLFAAVQVVFDEYVVVPICVAARADHGHVNDDGPNTTNPAARTQKTTRGFKRERKDSSTERTGPLPLIGGYRQRRYGQRVVN